MEYLSTPFNYMDMTGNALVLLTRFDRYKELEWIMLFLILQKGFLTLKVFSQFRTLIRMIE